MTKDRWGSEWPTPWPDDPFAWPKESAGFNDPAVSKAIADLVEANYDASKFKLTGLDLATGEERAVLTTFENDGIKHRVISQTQLKLQGSNLVDDQAYLYFQCESCNEILDPHTKSFAKLQEARAKAEWIVKWNLNGQGYKVYCQKCGEKV